MTIVAHPLAFSFSSLISFSSLQSMGSCIRHLLHHTGCVSKGNVRVVCIVYVSTAPNFMKTQRQNINSLILKYNI